MLHLVLLHLRAARALIADPGRWTQGRSARDARGEPVMPNADDATCWCGYGAMRRVEVKLDHPRAVMERAYALLSAAVRRHDAARRFDGSVVFFNDDRHRKHYEVLAVFDTAIAEARSRAQDAA